MAISVVMPALEMAQETGRLVKWRKREGERVSKGDLLMDVETDKAVVEVEADADGVLSSVQAREGDVIAVGQIIAWILAPGETAPTVAQPAATGRKLSAEPTAAAPQRAATATSPAGDRLLMSPKARRLAAEQGLDPRTLAAGGGVITSKDLAGSATSAAPSGEAPGTVWRVMAERMTTAWTTVPQFHVTRDVDAAALVSAREKLLAGAAPSVTFTDLFVAAAARAIRAHPRVIATWTNGSVRQYEDINIGIATAVDQAVVVPVIHGADRLSLGDLAKARAELVERARAGRLRPADLADGRFTISNLGTYQVDAFTAIVNPPEAAILAIGAIRERVVARDGQPVVRPIVTVTLSCDHRVLDGARGAAFLNDLVRILENGEGLS